MTSELAQAGGSLWAMASPQPRDPLLGRRLDRLRQGRATLVPRERHEANPGRERAESLAAELGGRLLETSHGPVALVESVHHVPVALAGLLRLPFSGASAGPLLCLDLETTGLGTGSGTLAFLVGLGRWVGSSFVVRQLLLADHADERALLAAVAGEVEPEACLITYNGRSFDWPLLVARYRLQHWDPPLPAGHLDLLPVARQLWRHRLGNARLATVEAGVCGVLRPGDLPGGLVPERYFAYLRERRPQLLREVLDHNRQDIVSLALLLQVLAGGLASEHGRASAHPGDLGGLARAYERHGRSVDALGCLDMALASPAWQRGLEGGGSLYRRLATQRAVLLNRVGRRAEAVQAWQSLAERGGPGAALAWLRVASHREHHERDLEGALAACRRAAEVCHRSRSWGHPLFAAEHDLRHRQARLERRLRGRVSARPAGSSIGRRGGRPWTLEQDPAQVRHIGQSGEPGATHAQAGRGRGHGQRAPVEVPSGAPAGKDGGEPGGQENITGARAVAHFVR